MNKQKMIEIKYDCMSCGHKGNQVVEYNLGKKMYHRKFTHHISAFWFFIIEVSLGCDVCESPYFREMSKRIVEVGWK